MTEEERYTCWTWHCGFKTENMKCFACNDTYIYRDGPHKHGWVRSLIIRNGIEISPNLVPICKSCSSLSHNYRDLLSFMNAKGTLTAEQAEHCRKILKNRFHYFIDEEDESHFDSHDEHCALCHQLEKNEKAKKVVKKRKKSPNDELAHLKKFHHNISDYVIDSNQ
jgi:hypothetical protein